MKMTKIDTAKKFIEQGNCMGISCNNCFTTRKECWDTAGNHRMIHLAEAYIKRNGRPKVKTTIKIGEVKAGLLKQEDIDKAKQDHIPDTTKVEYVRCVKNDNVPLTAGKIYEVVKESEVGFNVVDDVGEKRDYYKYRFEPAEKPVVKENFTPEPIKFEDPVPDVCYQVTPHAIKKKMPVHFIKKTENGEDVYYVEFNYGGKHRLDTCYKTFEDAVLVAKQKWEVEQ